MTKEPLAEALRAALDDEYKARATYRKILARHPGALPFAKIVESEERHIRALARLFLRYGIPMPPDTWPAVVEVPATLLEACQDGVKGERENAELYDHLLTATQDYPDVQETFRRLCAASQQNHLRAFERGVQREQRREAGTGTETRCRPRRCRHAPQRRDDADGR